MLAHGIHNADIHPLGSASKVIPPEESHIGKACEMNSGWPAWGAVCSGRLVSIPTPVASRRLTSADPASLLQRAL